MSSAATCSIVRLAAAWEHPAGRAFCAGLDGLVAGLGAEAVIHRQRNVLWRCPGPDGGVVIKRFALGRGWWGRLLARLRASKAVRSFEVARGLGARGLGTPEPLAAVECREGGRLVRAYYCCREQPHTATARSLKDPAFPGRDRYLQALGVFAARLHGSGVLHRDFNGTNLLLVGDPSAPDDASWSLIDLNRVRFGRVGALGGLANLALLGFSGPDLDTMLGAYLAERRVWTGDALARGAYRLLAACHRVRWALKSLTRPWRRRLAG